MDAVLSKLVKDMIADILAELLEDTDDSVGWLLLHTEKKDRIIKSFIKQAGISLSPDRTEDVKLYIRGSPDITV